MHPLVMERLKPLLLGFNLHIRQWSLGYIYDHCVLFQAEAFESLVMGPSKVIYLSMEQVTSTLNRIHIRKTRIIGDVGTLCHMMLPQLH